MHQTCIIKDKSNRWSLFAIGGKQNSQTWLKSVESFDLTPYYVKTGKVSSDGKPIESQWISVKDMNSTRSNFSISVIQN